MTGGGALRPYLADPVADGMATIGLTVNYFRPAAGAVSAPAAVVRAGGSVGVSAVAVENETPDGERAPVAVGQASDRLDG